VEKIVRSEIAIDRDAVRRALEQGLELVTSTPVRVQVSSIDLEYLRRILPEIMAEKPVDGVSVEAVDDLKDGDVRLVHPEGTVDLSLDAQLNVLRAAFIGGGNGAV
jgi:flagellar biosynthesis/type III secretory pathway protein FliH